MAGYYANNYRFFGSKVVSGRIFRYNKTVIMKEKLEEKNMTPRKHYPEMDRLRGIAILMVLLYHSILVYPINLTEQELWGKLHTFLWTVEMPLFFLVSGFCFRYEGHYMSYLKKKSLRILVPHFVFGVLDLLVRLVPTTIVHEQFDTVQALKEFFFYGANDWFLWTLFLVFLIAPILWRIMEKGKWGSAAVLVIALIPYLLQNKITYVFCLRNMVQFLIFFVIGMVLRKLREKEQAVLIQTAWWQLIVTAAVGLLLFWFSFWKGWTGDEGIWKALFGGGLFPLRQALVHFVVPGVTWLKICYLLVNLAVPLLLCYVVYGLACRMKSGKMSGFLGICSKYSLQMYLLDGYALVVTRTILVSVLGITNAWMIVLGNFLMDTAIVLFISRFVLDRWTVFRVASGLGRRK